MLEIKSTEGPIIVTTIYYHACTNYLSSYNNNAVPVICNCSLIGLVGHGEAGDVTDSELDLSDVTDAADEFCEDRCSLDSLSDTLQPI